ncbi:MAG: disulfide bond formation protein B [Alphaproteobacteria bacterium]
MTDGAKHIVEEGGRKSSCPVSSALLNLTCCRLTWRCGLFAAAAIACFALGFALISEYAFGYAPCVLCLWQRAPYALVAIIAAAGIFLPGLRRWRGVVILASALLLAVDAGLAVFHVGVEQHWWLGTSGCGIHDAAEGDTRSIRESLLALPVARCDEIAWTFLGFSMAAWNAVYATFATLLMTYILLFGSPENVQTQDVKKSGENRERA